MNWKDKIRNADCTLCPLHEGAEHVCLMGSGTRKAEVMLVGEAPGAREDEEHAAFVGAAGKVLTQYLEEYANLSRDDCYITNVVKCRPPDNRTPDPPEVKTCVANYFLKEMEAVKPKYVLLMGNSAMKGVVGKSGIKKHRGTRWEIDETIIMSTYHPAAVLRNPQYGEILASDMRRFGELARGVDPQPNTVVKIIRKASHLKWLLQNLRDVKRFSYDIETNALEEWRPGSKIVSIAFTWEDGSSAFVPLHHTQTPWKDPQAVLHTFAPYMVKKGRSRDAHNGKFDARWLNWNGVPVVQTFDTMLAGHMIEENRPKSLKHMSQVILQASSYDIGDEVKDAAKVPIRRLAVYNGKDTDYTFRLGTILREELKKEPRIARVFKFLMMPASNALVPIEQRGIQIDFERWQDRTAKAVAIREKIEKIMLTQVPKAKRAEFNFNSPQQVAEWLFSDLGLPILELTKSENPSTKESVLQQLAKESKVCAVLLKYRKWNKYLTTYLNPWMGHTDDNLRMHPGYKLFGTVTGRLSSVNPNLQQVPRDPFIRSILTAKEGYALVQADFSQVELRIAAMLAGESRMLAAFHRGDDLHLKTASETTGIAPAKIDKETRKKAKAVNFGFLYSMGAEKFVTYARDNYDVDISFEEADVVRERFFESYPMLRPWHERQKRLARRHNRVHSPLGRVRHLPDIESRDKAVRAEAERQAINSPVQSTASDLMLTALILLHEREVPIIGTIHDALLFEIKEDKLEKTLPLIKEVMESTALKYVKRYFGAEITVPITVDIDVGTHWGEGKEWSG